MTREPSLDSAAYYFILSAGGEPPSGEGTVITADPDGGMTSRPYLHLEEARALASVLSDHWHGFRKVYLAAQEEDLNLYQYRDREASKLVPFRVDLSTRSRRSPLADMA